MSRARLPRRAVRLRSGKRRRRRLGRISRSVSLLIHSLIDLSVDPRFYVGLIVLLSHRDLQKHLSIYLKLIFVY